MLFFTRHDYQTPSHDDHTRNHDYQTHNQSCSMSPFYSWPSLRGYVLIVSYVIILKRDA